MRFAGTLKWLDELDFLYNIKTMGYSDKEIFDYVKAKFGLIMKAVTVEELYAIENKSTIKSYKIDIDVYPKIDFTITPNEIKLLKSNGILNENYEMVTGSMNGIDDPLTKILYSIVWKNGDLKKIKHVIRGAAETADVDDANLPDDAIVFYQFGKYLSGKKGEPIIDQHVLRAFAIFIEPSMREIKKWREFEVVKKTHHTLIKKYITWLSSENITKQLKGVDNYTYYIDRVLFALGKYAKS
jgi:hypothetical protein